MKELLRKSGLNIFNLEVPLTDYEKPITKTGPNLIAPTNCVPGLKSLGFSLFTLANNHILDQDIQGLISTIKILDEAEIPHVGAGNNLKEAEKAFIIDIKGKRYGIYACAEHEFSIADVNKPGANPFDPLYSLDYIKEIKKTVDFLIVLYHGGKELYRYPSPRLQKVCRRLVDKGADLVICQHSHCIGCEERYNKGLIIYGQGNFLFDGSDDECLKTSVLVKIDCDFSVSYIPLIKHGNGVRLADYTKAKEILSEYEKRSNDIKREGFIEHKYDEFAKSFLPCYLRAMMVSRPCY